MFNEISRYAGLKTYEMLDRQGRKVMVVPVPAKPNEVLLGYHVLHQGQRLDHLAAHYLDNPAGFWRICELNDVLLPEALTEVAEVAIPRK
jgi:hypothetical protein